MTMLGRVAAQKLRTAAETWCEWDLVRPIYHNWLDAGQC